MGRLAPGTVALSAKYVGELHLKRPTGEQVQVTTPDGRVRSFTVAAIYSGIDHVGYALFNWDDMAAMHAATGDSMLLLRAADGISPAQGHAALDAALANYPLVTVGSVAEWRNKITGAVTKMIGMVAALLGFAILIALVGIVNTLSLSVLERTRESAMTRALGLTRGQLRATLLAEALLMAGVGAIVGVSFGVLYGLLTTNVLLGHETTWMLRIPVPQLLAFTALAAAAGALASILPARRAGRASIVSAMAET
jgi:putative ABC transport system permease protein